MKTKIKTQIFINKSIYLVPSILEISKIVIYEFWNDYGKPKYGEKANTEKKRIQAAYVKRIQAAL